MRRIICFLLIATCLMASMRTSTDAAQIDIDLLARAADALAENGSYTLHLAFCALIINRVNSESYPHSLAAVICDMGLDLPENASPRSRRAARDAISGSDPTRGALIFDHEAHADKRARIVIDGVYFY